MEKPRTANPCLRAAIKNGSVNAGECGGLELGVVLASAKCECGKQVVCTMKDALKQGEKGVDVGWSPLKATRVFEIQFR